MSRHQGTDVAIANNLSVIVWNCETSSNGGHCGKGSDNGYVIPMRQLADPSATMSGSQARSQNSSNEIRVEYGPAGTGLVCNLPEPHDWSLA
jgi:hypothetical protein